MAPIPQVDVDVDNPSSDVGEDSPMRRQFSEPFRPQSTSTQISQSPEPRSQMAKCSWCGKLLDVPHDGETTKEDVLRVHVASAHPKTIRFSDYDDAEEIDAENSYMDPNDEEAAYHEEELFNEEEPLNEDFNEEEEEEAEEGEEGEEPLDDEEQLIEEEILQDDEHFNEDERLNGAEPLNAEELAIHVTLPEEEHDHGGEEEPVTAAPSAVGDHSDDAERQESKPMDVGPKPSQTKTGKLDRLEWLSNPRSSFPDDYRERLSKWQEPDVKSRLSKAWSIHDVKKFCPEYEQDEAKIKQTWQHVLNSSDSKPKKREVPEPITQHGPYKKIKVDKGEFLPIESPDKLVELLRHPENLTPDELYAVTETAAFAMRVWQDEYLALDKLYLYTHRHHREPLPDGSKRSFIMGNKKKTNHPLARVPEDERDFEDRKEAMLYGYKHTYFQGNTSTQVAWAPQDAFVQGGFVPTPAQGRKMAAKTAPDDPNPDGFAPVIRDGIEHFPKLWEPRKEPTLMKFTRKRKAAEVEAASKAATDTEETQGESPEADETDEEQQPAKRRTRGRGGRRSGVEFIQSELSTPARRGGRGRGRGRGRGVGRPSTRASLEIHQAYTPPSSSRGRGRGRGGMATTQTRSVTDTSSLPALSPMGTSPSGTPSATKQTSAEALEEARRLKIANSKNPKRTKAMLDHWDRFNREGRIRNPKRSKAQIEQDRVVEETRKAVDPPRPSGRRRRSPSLAPIPTGNLAPKASPGLPSLASSQHMGQGMPPNPPMPGSMGMPPYGHHGHPNPFGAPPGPPGPPGPPPPGHVQLGQPMPPQYAPFPYVPYNLGHLGPPRDPHRR
ncbi:hypothetical protein N7474_004040 [Penicillium riverlandense]|uniref:uncharacterized protein n=1 Tax=Penicillium riverlandense TaxID=1903569 RepID=UPI002549058D|nr:uncharacterized protein N7474_004040 [Penicillium riverlandense]KAJ5818449.1 hypothetical protein N7474_004040 [Penicillium riverlandense]